MVRVFLEEKKGKYKIIAVADHQRDLNNLRLLSYRLRGADKVMLNKDKYGGPYVVLDCDQFANAEGQFDLPKLNSYIQQLQQDYQ